MNSLRWLRMPRDIICEILTNYCDNEYQFNNIWFTVVDGDKGVGGTISYVQEEADTYDSVVMPIVKSIKIK